VNDTKEERGRKKKSRAEVHGKQQCSTLHPRPQKSRHVARPPKTKSGGPGRAASGSHNTTRRQCIYNQHSVV
jgi:hypothetical protein